MAKLETNKDDKQPKPGGSEDKEAMAGAVNNPDLDNPAESIAASPIDDGKGTPCADDAEATIDKGDLDKPEIETVTTDTAIVATTAMEHTVQFVNQEVLNATITPMNGMAKPMVNQAAAMMVQDVQTFLQGNEQILTVAIAKAISYTLDSSDPAKQAAGTATIGIITGLLTSLNEFSASVGETATTIASEFNG